MPSGVPRKFERRNGQVRVFGKADSYISRVVVIASWALPPIKRAIAEPPPS
jgi:hypothetical protein